MPLPEILKRIRAAEAAAGRPEGSVQLIAVSKTRPLDLVMEKVLAHGEFALGENKGQELRDKIAEWEERFSFRPPPSWHFIGPLQSNKIRYMATVHTIHSVESLAQLEHLAKAAEKWGRAPNLLLQRHNGEDQKGGCPPQDLPKLLAAAREMGLPVVGLMAMAPIDDGVAARRVFAETARDAANLGLPELSMGMSGDFEAAIAEGATMVRVGSALYR